MVWKMGKAKSNSTERGILGHPLHITSGAGPLRRGVFRAVKRYVVGVVG